MNTGVRDLVRKSQPWKATIDCTSSWSRPTKASKVHKFVCFKLCCRFLHTLLANDGIQRNADIHVSFAAAIRKVSRVQRPSTGRIKGESRIQRLKFMDEAILVSTGETYQAATVTTLPNPASLKWKCPGCEMGLHPNSYKPHNKVAAYFSRSRGTEHGEHCTIEGIEKVVKGGEEYLSKNWTQVVGSIPTLIDFRPDHERKIAPGHLNSEAEVKDRYKPPSSSTSANMLTHSHRRTAKTIRTACRIHSVLPNHAIRRKLRLEIDECKGSTYYDVFWKLHEIIDDAPPRLAGCIFYASLRFKDRPNYDNPRQLELILNCGHSTSSVRLRRPYRVIVDWSQWSQQQRNWFAKRFEAQREDVSVAYFDARKNGKPSPSATLYVLAVQDTVDPLVFRVSDARKIALIFQANGLYWDVKAPWGSMGESAQPEQPRAEDVLVKEKPVIKKYPEFVSRPNTSNANGVAFLNCQNSNSPATSAGDPSRQPIVGAQNEDWRIHRFPASNENGFHRIWRGICTFIGLT